MNGRRIVARGLSLIAALALVTALLPNLQFQTGVDANGELLEHLQKHPEQIPARHHVTLGLEFSPLLEYLSETGFEERDNSYHYRASQRVQVGWFSWSAMLLVVSLVLFQVRARVRWFQTPPA